ncbi:lantibiotic immunity ABC transporter MutG family permease subunit [Thermoactinomyces mirandus]|uniref:Lantibiotic immunity ABC transporter MutG family permease subunit n=1 Tax=Thermoactinomyces mirandus TaxID=2756294 RepID=A0A7W1XTM8_9BACL|nr:lantibiotic immunity ABC transporter MutG family permease subunit [Thermoactinomyces mirandus]MBA4603078.1 lantibiotic immunity ABC transporter MutG family permease subunit [Thermoactinomyces mirandus]
MNLLSSEWLKTKRTPVRWFVFLIPVVFAALMIWYYSFRFIPANIQISMYRAFFEVWAALAIPLGTGLLSGMIIHQEELAGSFNGLLGSRLPRRDMYLGKLLFLFLLASASTLLAVLTFMAGAEFILEIRMAWPIFIAGAIMAIVGMTPLLVLNLWISLAWGMGASVGVGSFGLMMAALMVTNLGDQIWPWVPWAWPVRLSIFPGVYLWAEPGMKYPPQIISSGFVLDQAIKGLVPAILFFVVMLFGSLVWFKRWEGRKVYE